MPFFDSIKRWRLAQKGMSSGKKRRTTTDDSLAAKLDRSFLIRWLMFLLFIAALVFIVATAHDITWFTPTWWRSFVVASAIGIGAFVVLRLNHDQVALRTSRVVLMLGGIILQLLAILGVFSLVGRAGWDESFEVLLAPFILAPMIHTPLLGKRAGVFSAVFSSLCSSLLIGSVDSLAFFVISLTSGLTAVMVLRNVRKRGKLLRAGIYAGVITLLFSIAFEYIGTKAFTDAATVADWKEFGWRSLAAFGVGIILSLLIGGILPALEGVFGLTTEMSWIELSDLNNKLLRRMQLEAAGTFHHSLVVASLSEAAAESIGAHATMCRVCAYFHDIGKLSKPEYFIENQNDGVNPHDTLTPTMSALIITAHVKDGVDLAIKHKLNPRIIDVIKEHHGDSLVYYFYRKACEQQKKEEEKADQGLENKEDIPEVDQKNFRYPGPRPSTKESGIISLADSIESASRSLTKPTPQRIISLIDDIVQKRINDGQLNDCPLSLKEITIIKKSFAKTLRSMLHSRIDYPKGEDSNDTKAKKAAKKESSKVKEAPTKDVGLKTVARFAD